MTSPDVQERLHRALGTAYAVERELAGGGMSRVFVADEAALGRKVVVKVLRPELAEGLSSERFNREVRLAARLQHPHVVPLLAAGDIGDGLVYYTMPFVEGESLRARIEHVGALPIAEVVLILRDVASALAYAHGRGIVHRDIKPENVLLSHGGALVADFGIAKAISESMDAPVTDGAERLTPLTAAGTSLGTPAYMAPEQAAGDVVDHRADLYSLGVVAYEMLSGHPPFEGRTAQQLLAAHATQLPEPVGRRRASVPSALGALVMRLLEKHPADRPQSGEEVIVALDEAAGTAQTTPDAVSPTSKSSRSIHAMPWVVAIGVTLAALGAGAALGWDLGTRRPTDGAAARTVVSTLSAPPGYELRPDDGHALSPDGNRLVFVAANARGVTSLWVRSLDEAEARRLEETEGATGPFWSPDGQWLGYFAAGSLRAMRLQSETRIVMCLAPRPGGGTWMPSGVIVYSPDFLALPLYGVPALPRTGPCTPLIRSWRGDFGHRHPSALPDGRHVLLSSYSANTAFMMNAETGELREVRLPGNEAQFAPPNWMLFRDPIGTGGQTGPLYAQRLDMDRLLPIGEPRVVLDHTSGIGAYSRYSVTERVIVAVRPSSRPWTLLWVDRRSAVVDSVIAPPEAGPVLNATNVDLSHDGRSIVFGGIGMWIHSRVRNAVARTAAETMAGQAVLDPAWSPGDSLIAYTTGLRGPVALRLYHVRAGTSDSLLSYPRRTFRGVTWSPDGTQIAFQASAGSVVRDEIWIYTLATRRTARAFEAAGNLSIPRWSPDGRWMAYVSDETGAPEVYVRHLGSAAGGVRVSNAGGDVPQWRADGQEIFYRAPDGTIMGVRVTLRGAVVLSKPQVVVANPPFSATARTMVVTRDGSAFVAFARGEAPVFTLVQDWAEKIR